MLMILESLFLVVIFFPFCIGKLMFNMNYKCGLQNYFVLFQCLFSVNFKANCINILDNCMFLVGRLYWDCLFTGHGDLATA